MVPSLTMAQLSAILVTSSRFFTATGVSEIVELPWPRGPMPQHRTTPSWSSAQVGVTLTADVMSNAATGTSESRVLRLPSCPVSSLPQHQTVRSSRDAQVWSTPAAIATAPVMPVTLTGTGESTIVPSPSCPLPFLPQHCRVLSLKIAHVESSTEEIAITSEMPTTITGVSEGDLVPSPSWPTPLEPQQDT